MNKLAFLPFAAFLPFLACSSQTKQPETSTISEKEAMEPAEKSEPSLQANLPFKIQKFEKEVGENELQIEYPVSGNPALVASVRNWLNEQLSDTYKGDMDNPEAFFRHYAARLGQDPDLNEYGGYTKDEFEVEYENDYIVTYDYTYYVYEGGAHGMGGSYGTTFLQSDGKIFDKECITSYASLHQLFIDGLKRYFKVKTDQELLGCLLSVNDLKQLAPPGMKPWIEEEGVAFSYTPYEIAPYSAGSPNFIIPYSKIAPYLTSEGKRFFGE